MLLIINLPVLHRLSVTMISTMNNLTQKQNLEKLLESEYYKENVEFWERAWGGVKTAYTQMPELPYLPLIPETLEKKNAKVVLDLGCGSGWLSIFLARHKFKVTGIDISKYAIDLAKAWAEKENLPIDFHPYDIAKIPFEEGSFDAVVANSIFEHFPFEATREIFDILKFILKDNGVLVACFDEVGMGAGEFFKLEDDTHVYTDKARKGMLLRNYTDSELDSLLKSWKVESITPTKGGSKFIIATK